MSLGREAFSRYPVQLAEYMPLALGSRADATDYGLWIDGTRGVGGLVRVELADGSTTLALTCSTCHAARRNGTVADGVPNASLDLGRAMLEANADASAGARALAAWGRGRVDVTTLSGMEPQRIPDLRPVRWLTHLHQEATVSLADRTALAIRIETLIITGHGEVLRPPRVVALALARYVETLAEPLPSTQQAAQSSPRGTALFAQLCARCHAPPSLTGPPVALAEIGTDPMLGRSQERGTGTYRVPSLHGVGSRGPLLHDGTVPTLQALLDPARLADDWPLRLHGTGAVRGHVYGLELSKADRGELVRYLEAL